MSERLIQDNNGLDDHKIILCTEELQDGWFVVLELYGDSQPLRSEVGQPKRKAEKVARQIGKALDIKVYELSFDAGGTA